MFFLVIDNFMVYGLIFFFTTKAPTFKFTDSPSKFFATFLSIFVSIFLPIFLFLSILVKELEQKMLHKMTLQILNSDFEIK